MSTTGLEPHTAPPLRPSTVDCYTVLPAYRRVLAHAPGACGGRGSHLDGARQPDPLPWSSGRGVERPLAASVGGTPMGPPMLGDRVLHVDRHGAAHAGPLPDVPPKVEVARLTDEELDRLQSSAPEYVDVRSRAMASR